MNFLRAQKLLEAVEGLRLLTPANAVCISNNTIEELLKSVQLIEDDGRQGLPLLHDVPAWGVYFAEFWEECPSASIGDCSGQIFGIGRAEFFIREPDRIIHTAFDQNLKNIEQTYAGRDTNEFAQVFLSFHAACMRHTAYDFCHQRNTTIQDEEENKKETRSRRIAAELREAFPKLTSRIGPDGSLSYWFGIVDALEHEELQTGKDFLYYRDRAALLKREANQE